MIASAPPKRFAIRIPSFNSSKYFCSAPGIVRPVDRPVLPLPTTQEHLRPVCACASNIPFCSSALGRQKLYTFTPCAATALTRSPRGIVRGNMISTLIEVVKSGSIGCAAGAAGWA